VSTSHYVEICLGAWYRALPRSSWWIVRSRARSFDDARNKPNRGTRLHPRVRREPLFNLLRPHFCWHSFCDGARRCEADPYPRQKAVSQQSVDRTKFKLPRPSPLKLWTPTIYRHCQQGDPRVPWFNGASGSHQCVEAADYLRVHWYLRRIDSKIPRV